MSTSNNNAFDSYNRNQFSAQYTDNHDVAYYVAIDQAKRRAVRKENNKEFVAALNATVDFAFTTTISAIGQLKIAIPVALVVFAAIAAYKYL
jgi:hypothetical protein